MADSPAGGAARALLPWMSDDQARRALAGQGGQLTADQEKQLAAGRDEVRRRPAGADQADLIRPLPGGMRAYAARLEADPEAAAGPLAEGFTPALADLTRLCAFQPTAPVGQALERVARADPFDMPSLAAITLPLAAPARLIPDFDQDRMTFTTSLPSQNLQIVGAFGGPSAEADELPPGTISVGFHLRAVTSFVQVASVNGRYFLRDGYHRCLGLLRRGVRYAPVLARENVPVADLAPPGSLDLEVLLGARPPVLPDYWDDKVSIPVVVPPARRLVVVRASELSVTEGRQRMTYGPGDAGQGGAP
jgi:hypothetical protein